MIILRIYEIARQLLTRLLLYFAPLLSATLTCDEGTAKCPELHKLRRFQNYFDRTSNNTVANIVEKFFSERFPSFTDVDVEKFLEAEENKNSLRISHFQENIK